MIDSKVPLWKDTITLLCSDITQLFST